jgi:hypothetical protein
MSDTPERHHDAERRFAERLAAHYRPEPLGGVERARFDAALRERIGRRRRARAFAPALAGAAGALALAFWAWPAATPAPGSGGDPVASRQAGAAADREVGAAEAEVAAGWEAEVAAGWEADVLLAADAEPADEDYLPDEYVALAAAFLDGP